MTGKGSGIDVKKKREGLSAAPTPQEFPDTEPGESPLEPAPRNQDLAPGDTDRIPVISALGRRIDMKLREKNLSIDQLNQLTGIPRRSLDNYRTGQTEPRASRLRLLGKALGVSLDWLVPENEPEKLDPPEQVPTPTPEGIPLTTLAGCGFRGWFLEGILHVHTRIPEEIAATPPEELRAVLAIGESMLPESIPPGAICYCRRNQPPAPHRAVFLRTSDGRASIKLFLRETAKAVFLRGWLPPNEGESRQAPYQEEVPRAMVQEILPVIFIRTLL